MNEHTLGESVVELIDANAPPITLAEVHARASTPSISEPSGKRTWGRLGVAAALLVLVVSGALVVAFRDESEPAGVITQPADTASPPTAASPTSQPPDEAEIFALTSDEHPTALAETAEGSVLIGIENLSTPEASVVEIDAEGTTTRTTVPGTVVAIEPHPDGGAWLTTENQFDSSGTALVRYQNGDAESIDTLLASSTLASDVSRGELWIAMEPALERRDLQSGQLIQRHVRVGFDFGWIQPTSAGVFKTNSHTGWLERVSDAGIEPVLDLTPYHVRSTQLEVADEHLVVVAGNQLVLVDPTTVAVDRVVELSFVPTSISADAAIVWVAGSGHYAVVDTASSVEPQATRLSSDVVLEAIDAQAGIIYCTVDSCRRRVD